MEGWLADNWFNLLSAVGIIGSLLFTAVSLRSETATRRITNLLTLTQNHRELWRELFHNPELKAVLEPLRNPASKPVTTEEYYFVTMAIQHLHSAFKAMETGLVTKPAGIREDIRKFFALPVPHAVWDKVKAMQSQDFTRFVADCLERREESELRLAA